VTALLAAFQKQTTAGAARVCDSSRVAGLQKLAESDALRRRANLAPVASGGGVRDHVRLPNAAHEANSWAIAEIVPDFKLLDVWRLPAQGSLDDFYALLEIMASLEPTKQGSRAARALFRLRYRLGALFGWDDRTRSRRIPDATDTTLRARLPENLRGTATRPDLSRSSFTGLYRTDTEWAAELSNATVHAVMHLAWVAQGAGLYRGQMGIYVKPRGRLGATYMAVIGPFRHLIVYPALMREIERAWEARPTRD
jgi:hypothetical protein